MPPGTPPRRANTFFALTLPAPVRDAVSGLQARLAARLADQARPVPPANFHITLAFLGSVSEAAVPELCALAEEARLPSVDLALDRLGSFPRARVGWLGCVDVPPALVRFQGRLAAAVAEVGFAGDDRPWVPHLTLYRNLRTTLPKLAFEPLSWRVERFELLRTASGETGPVYRSCGRWPARDEGGSTLLP